MRHKEAQGGKLAVLVGSERVVVNDSIPKLGIDIAGNSSLTLIGAVGRLEDRPKLADGSYPKGGVAGAAELQVETVETEMNISFGATAKGDINRVGGNLTLEANGHSQVGVVSVGGCADITIRGTAQVYINKIEGKRINASIEATGKLIISECPKADVTLSISAGGEAFIAGKTYTCGEHLILQDE